MSGEFDFAETALEPGLSVVEASAGTGKTYAISHLVPRLLLEGTAGQLGEILLVTFTKDAARELSDRVRRVLEKLDAPPTVDEARREPGVHRLRQKFEPERISRVIGQALFDLDRLQVSTIHSFCQRTLQTEGSLCGLPVVPELIPDADDLIDETLYDLWEALVAADPLASAVAAELGWQLADDLRFVRAALPLENAVAVPAAESFSANLRRLDDYAGRFTGKVCGELAELWARVGRWNRDGEGEDRAGLLDALRGAERSNAPGFLAAVRKLAGSMSWIAKPRQTDVRAAVEQSAAYGLAQEVDTLLTRLRWDFRHEILGAVRERVSSALRASRRITYDGLIDALCAALRGPQSHALAEPLRRRYRVALIDESQDTDPRQFEIFRKVFVGFGGEGALSGHRLVLIGDPKQAIYAFRGADVNTYLGARDDAGSRIFRLTRTYRAPPALVEAINAVFDREGSLLKDGLTFRAGSSGIEGDVQLVMEGKPSAHRLEAWCVPDAEAGSYSTAKKRERLIADIVASEIVRILNAGAKLVRTVDGAEVDGRAVRPGDIAVLVNSHREAAAMSDALLARRVPAIRAGDEDVMASEEAGELLILLRALHEPRRGGFRLAALGGRLLGRTSADLAAIRGNAELEDAHLQRFTEWQEYWHRFGIAAALARIDQEEGITARLAPLERGERRVTNLRQIVDLVQAASLESGHRPGHLVRWLAQEIARASGRSGVEERQQQLESDADAVQIVTMHAAKGLEYPLVFCPFLWASQKPRDVQRLSSPGHPPRLVNLSLCEDPDVCAEVVQSALEDRLRLAYVALTRAKAKVWVLSGEICGSRNRPPASPLDWLLDEEGTIYSADWRKLVEEAGRGARHGAGWERVAQRANGAIAVAAPPAPNATAWTPLPVDASVSPSPLPAPGIPAPWRLTSFSALTKEKNPHAGRDATRAPFSLATSSLSASAAFLSAPGGAMVGTAIHEWIEGWDFSEPAEENVARHLRGYPLPGGAGFPLVVREMLGTLRGVRLPELDCTVAQACPDPRSSEWHFQLPIGRTLSPEKLAAVFADHGHADYAAALALLPADELAGYLHGFLDRVACFDGVWGVIDWKTNNLGPTPDHYGPTALAACARQSHYLLQAHLYLVALRRYLGPGAPIAGAWLVFLRGIRAGSSDGVFTVQPSPALMSALDALFAQPSISTAP